MDWSLLFKLSIPILVGIISSHAISTQASHSEPNQPQALKRGSAIVWVAPVMVGPLETANPGTGSLSA